MAIEACQLFNGLQPKASLILIKSSMVVIKSKKQRVVDQIDVLTLLIW
jgi:hypothetical protein